MSKRYLNLLFVACAALFLLGGIAPTAAAQNTLAGATRGFSDVAGLVKLSNFESEAVDSLLVTVVAPHQEDEDAPGVGGRSTATMHQPKQQNRERRYKP